MDYGEVREIKLEVAESAPAIKRLEEKLLITNQVIFILSLIYVRVVLE